MSVSLAADFVFAAGGRTVGMVNEDVIVAGGAEDAINGFAELGVAGIEGVIGFGFGAGHGKNR